ncbi:MAG: prepilin-type N-terminal cleavage/methylation domain-containing protein [Lysobacter sp.]
MRTGPAIAAERGFTLIEVLLATVLLAAGLALAFATLSAASQTASRGESLAARSERVRAVEGFLRKRLAAARPIAFSTGQDNAPPQRFLGEPERMRFVADLPDYLGRGGPYSHDVRIQRSGGATRIELVLDIVSAGETIPDPVQRAPELLVDGLATARFRYRGLDAVTGELGAWQDRWGAPERLPLLVEATFTDIGGATWPTLVVALPQAMGVETGNGVVGSRQ